VNIKHRNIAGAALVILSTGLLVWWASAFLTVGPWASAPRFVVYVVASITAGRVFHGRWR
jgi:hypothetical protein